MDLSFSHVQAQRVVKQRNVLLALSAVLGLATLGLSFTASARDREIVLQPVLTRPMTLSSAGVSPEYLEAVTRDAALLTLNRTPQSMEYWMQAVLEIVHPAAYGKVKGDLMEILEDQRGSSIAQFFTMSAITVDPDALTSEVTGTLHTMVGRQEVSAVEKKFRYGWSYTGVSLKLVQFGMVEEVKPEVKS